MHNTYKYTREIVYIKKTLSFSYNFFYIQSYKDSFKSYFIHYVTTFHISISIFFKANLKKNL